MPRFLLMLLAVASAAQAQVPPTPTAPRDPVGSARCSGAKLRFGCANSANLEAMADPEDLIAGRAPSLSRGSQDAAAIARLDADKVKDLRREGTEGGGPQ